MGGPAASGLYNPASFDLPPESVDARQETVCQADQAQEDSFGQDDCQACREAREQDEGCSG
jgi:hypothetical protein